MIFLESIGSRASLSAGLNAGQTTKVVCFVFVVCRRLQATATHRKNKPPRAIALHPAVVEALLTNKGLGLLVKIVDKIGVVFVYWSKLVDKYGCLPAFSTCI